MLAPLLQAQNSDGGWCGQHGSPSWTEPTAWAVLALQQLPGHAAEARERGLVFLRKHQRPDGGWPPTPLVPMSNWVAAVVALLPPHLLGDERHRHALSYLEASAERLPGWTERLRTWMLWQKPPSVAPVRGWPWFPGTASWLVPTAVSLLALRKYGCKDPQLIEDANRYLLARQCADGGWNHGASQALGHDAPSYPETTGLALLAAGTSNPRGLAAAVRHASQCFTSEGRSWLRLALHRHNERFPVTGPVTPNSAPRELAIALLVDRCLDGEDLL